jgi:catechol 2,3-dioxygenase-like lactoylglutathione lyase family enzyme
MSADRNAPPETGWAKMVAELHVTDLNASLAFWKDIIRFEIAYSRQEEKFVYLEHPEGHQIMLCQRHGGFETGPMQHPLGQGAMFQFYFQNIDTIMQNLIAQSWPIYLGPREVWRRTGDRESGQCEVFVQDPDGYLLMLAHSIGQRVLGAASDPNSSTSSSDVPAKLPKQ